MCMVCSLVCAQTQVSCTRSLPGHPAHHWSLPSLTSPPLTFPLRILDPSGAWFCRWERLYMDCPSCTLLDHWMAGPLCWWPHSIDNLLSAYGSMAGCTLLDQAVYTAWPLCNCPCKLLPVRGLIAVCTLLTILTFVHRLTSVYWAWPLSAHGLIIVCTQSSHVKIG